MFYLKNYLGCRWKHVENITGCMPSIKLYLIYPLRTFVIVYHHMCTIYHSTNFGMQTHYEQSHAGLTYFINPFFLWRFVRGTCFHLNWKQFRITKTFKIALQKSLPVSNKVYSYGKRKCNIIHSRLRMGCSELNAHLYNYHVIENPKCASVTTTKIHFITSLYVQHLLWNAMCY